MKRVVILLALALTIAVPFLLRPPQQSLGAADDTLVIITPHNEAIRHEFGLAFAKWYEARTGRSVAVDWRVIGGTSEIARFLEGEYVASFRNHWTNTLGRSWSNTVQGAFHDGRLPTDASPEEKEARAAFLDSNVGCGIDLFFGGGTYDFIRQARAGRLVPSRIFTTHPEWFAPEIIPQEFAGEEYWDQEHRWMGTVLSSYGLIYNRDALAHRGLSEPPAQWDDLRDPRLRGAIALTDPTKSGSIAKAFENVIQQQMQRRLYALEATATDHDAAAREAQAVREGWIDGLQLLQIAAANARYFTDTSQKPPIDVATGNCAVGMCIDFYGRQQAEAVRRRGDSVRVDYVSPVGGSVSSVDPLGLLRGARHEEVAELFIEFVMSMTGQKLWNFEPGTADGPEHFALRRLPVRRDFYVDDFKPMRSDPEDAPYEAKEQLIYRANWTGALFREMSLVIRIMGFDTHPELTAAWADIVAAGRPPEAMAVLQDMSAVDYETALSKIKATLGSRDKVLELELAKELGAHFRIQYARAAEIARASR
ncbi:ABC transporter substrate-binding protein [Synoicihabitans lomoniglobus]|uniref:ABC transporter substrate-binding protein n=1 Tax=Synoicihabitans lomoniglobus TaxID=2909285 RepID=A0AAF0I3F9_9BACT|nr:ABC transporter substrate-binding protein [Opitutaceae bacterium LMO-M01]WED67092.1 ABC transporter substrate-binding protein [Opitutaceae bacterium LMO-M01]